MTTESRASQLQVNSSICVAMLISYCKFRFKWIKYPGIIDKLVSKKTFISGN